MYLGTVQSRQYKVVLCRVGRPAEPRCYVTVLCHFGGLTHLVSSHKSHWFVSPCYVPPKNPARQTGGERHPTKCSARRTSESLKKKTTAHLPVAGLAGVAGSGAGGRYVWKRSLGFLFFLCSACATASLSSLCKPLDKDAAVKKKNKGRNN